MSPKEACNEVWKGSPVREIERVELAAHEAAAARVRLLAVRPASGSSQAVKAGDAACGGATLWAWKDYRDALRREV